MIKVAAVVVTNNRIALLKECLSSIKNQTYKPDSVIVVNNASTDGTTEWLSTQKDIIVINQQNLGGSGGFYTGIKKAVALGAASVWVMDDDTICRTNTLQLLVANMESVNERVGFVGSKSEWKDGSPHLMNVPAIMPSFNKTIPFNKYDKKGLLLIETTSFVSLLLNADAIKSVGLPYKDFFIWGDDQEYTRRITKAGYLGLYCKDSIVLHKTPINYCPDFYHDTVPNLWKHRYGFRNEFFMIKKNKGFIFFIFWLFIKVIYTSMRLLFSRNDHRLIFVWTLCIAAWNSIFFNPKIDWIK